MLKFSLETNFRGLATPTKIKAAKICTDEELVTAITADYPHLQKFIHMKFNRWNIVSTNNFTLTVFDLVWSFPSGTLKGICGCQDRPDTTLESRGIDHQLLEQLQCRSWSSIHIDHWVWMKISELLLFLSLTWSVIFCCIPFVMCLGCMTQYIYSFPLVHYCMQYLLIYCS